MTATPGKRRPNGTRPWNLNAAEYCIYKKDLWVRLPNDIGPCRLSTWTYVVHEDGTITADPSILDHATGWHGYLRHGVFEEV